MASASTRRFVDVLEDLRLSAELTWGGQMGSLQVGTSAPVIAGSAVPTSLAS